MEPFPYGYRVELVRNEDEQRIIARIGNMLFEDGLSQRQVAEQLNKEGVKCRGRPWFQGTISKIVKREFRNRKPQAPPSWRWKARRKDER